MPTAPGVDLVKVVMSGTVGIGSQTWSTGYMISVGGGTAVTQALLDAYVNSLKPSIATMMATWMARNSTAVQYNGLKGSFIPANTFKASLVSVATITPVVGSGGATLPGFCSLVQSLRTANPSRTGRGRMYAPTNKLVLGGDGEALAADVNSVGPATAAMMTAVNLLPVGFSSGNGFCSVVSYATGFAHPVTRVVCDSRVDVQHRRTDKLPADTTNTTNV